MNQMLKDEPLKNIIDRSLNYGRHLISEYLGNVNHNSTIKVALDIGAGNGTDLMLVRNENPAVELHAIELHPESQRTLVQQGIIVHPLNIERDNFPFSDESVDIVIANQILEHIKEIFWVFHEISRVLKVGGYLIIGVPNLASLHNRFLLLLGMQPTCIQNHSAHIRAYTKSDLLKFLQLCFPGGYQLTKFGGSNFYPFPPVLAKPFAKFFPNLAWGIFFLFRKERAYSGSFLAHPIQNQLETNFYTGNI